MIRTKIFVVFFFFWFWFFFTDLFQSFFTLDDFDLKLLFISLSCTKFSPTTPVPGAALGTTAACVWSAAS
jgi:hypothetical protein